MTRIPTPLLCATLLAILLAACSNKDDTGITTQLAAKVGSQDISVQQVDQLLSRTNAANAAPQALPNLRRDVLEKLIDQQLVVGQAIESKLDRAPEVVAMIDAARREVLARVYLQQVTGSLPKPTPEEARKYYTAHPALFAERRVFNLQEVQLPAAAGATTAEQVRSLLDSGRPMDDIAALLKLKGVKFGSGAATRAAEQIPLELLAQVHALRDGQSMVVQNPQGFHVIRVAASQSAPVAQDTALPRIEQFLANQRRAEAVSQNLGQLRAKANISYFGEFAKAPSVAASGGK